MRSDHLFSFMLVGMMIALCIPSEANVYTFVKDKMVNSIIQPAEDATHLGQCGKAMFESTMKKGVKMMAAKKPHSYERTASMLRQLKLNNTDAIPDGDNKTTLMTEEMYYRYGMFCALTYCTSEDAKNMSSITLDQKPLLLGQFHITDWWEEDKILYYVAVQPAQKSIIVAFRGSDNFSNYKKDADGRMKALSTFEYNQPSDPEVSARCPAPSQAQQSVFRGFMDATPMRLLNSLTGALHRVKRSYPDYKLLITGHSLGAAQAMLTALYITLYHSDTLPVTAVYSYGQPPVGTTETNQWIAKCIGNDRIIRLVSSNDIIPFARLDDQHRHSPYVQEVFAPDPWKRLWKADCQGDRDPKCSTGVPCNQKNWDNHSQFAGLPVKRMLCALTLKKDGEK